ncbi:gas vesicle protein GvpG [Kribbella sp. NPDC026611]|uniref:gas vesicle protein GvpG n=1 Tax=Kribbella sp. NPDC026611 TaxID=3154911 RepID=UPI0033CDA17A
MGLFLGLLTAPLAPLRATVAIAAQIRQQAIREYYDPGRIRYQLDEIDRLRSAGVLDEATAEELEDELLERLLEGQTLTEGPG